MTMAPAIVLRPQPAELPLPTSYAALIRRNWNRGADLVVIEHDITLHEQVFETFQNCASPWCVFPYALTTRYAGYLGCVRFRACFMAAHPDAADDAALLRWGSWQPGDWRSYADCLWQALDAAHAPPHVHLPPVAHSNPRQRIRAEQERLWCKWPVDLLDP